MGRVSHERVARCVCLGVGCGGKYHVDGVYIILSARKVFLRRRGSGCKAWSCQGAKTAAQTRTGQARVDVVCKQAAKAPCTWRTPPPAGAGPPYYPYAKVISSAGKDLQGSLCLRVPPPSRGRSPLLPVCKSYQQCKKRPTKSPFAQRAPPPSRGRFPLLPVCKSYQQCTKPPPHANGARFRVILYCHSQSRTAVVLLGLTLAGPQICNGVSA